MTRYIEGVRLKEVLLDGSIINTIFKTNRMVWGSKPVSVCPKHKFAPFKTPLD